MSPTLSPTTQEVVALVDCLEAQPGVDTEALLQDTGSPQFRAARWLADDDGSGLATVCNQRLFERYALLAMYYATNGPNWDICNENDPACVGNSQQGWRSDADICNWYRVRCNTDGLVDSIDFVCESSFICLIQHCVWYCASNNI